MQQQLIDGQQSGIWCVSAKGSIWLPDGNLPQGLAATYQLTGHKAQHLGQWQGQDVWLICHSMPADMCSPKLLLSVVDMGLFQFVAKAVQLANFYRSHRFCGYCGHKMHWSKTEWCCLCRHCRERYYPQIAPSIIVAIRREDKILLANHVNHGNNIYTTLAGFVEVGETLEQAVHREVFEESNIRIKNLRYVASQPWPFPHSLMVGYLADYDEGEINIDPAELRDANWFRYDALPQLPAYYTIARRLIEDTIALCSAEYEEE